MAHDTDGSFGSLLRSYRLARGLSQEELADQAGLSREAISLLERGERRTPRPATIALLAEAMKLSATERAHLHASALKPQLRPAPAPLPRAQPSSAFSPRLTSFVGREAEIAEVVGLVRTKRLVTLTGPGGIGKTSLAREVVATVQSEFADGAVVVELAPLANDLLVPSTVAATLDVQARPGESLRVALERALGSSNRLLLLDNCEHVILSCAQLIEDLLRACPHLRILATSREALRIGAEVIWRVPPLTLPLRDNVPLTTLVQSEALRLFLDRAQAVRPDFCLSETNATPVSEICHRLDGIPLALELAAARLKVLDVEEIAVRLHDRFKLLTAGHRTALPRQQTLRATLDWSYNLLSTPERAVFRRLSVFAGGFFLDAAEVVSSPRDVERTRPEPPSSVHRADILDLVSQLVDKSLVLVDQPPTGTRYRVLETVRQYAHDRLVEAGEAEAAHDRHCEWCLQLAERAKPELIGPRQAFWLDRLEMERNNIRAALAWAVERGPAEMALRLAAPLWRFYLIRDQPSEGWDWLTRVLAASAEHVPTSRRAEVLEGAAALASWLGNHADVQRMAEESLAINRALGDHRGSAVALGHLAVCAVIRADFDRMEEFAVEALAEARKSGDSNAIGRAFLIHGANAWYRGNLLVARYRFEECMGIWRGTGDRRGLQGVLVFLGMVTCQEGDYIAARTYLEEALAIGRELCSNARIGEALVGLGDLARLHGDDGKARALVTEGLGLLREAGNRERIATALFHLGAVARREGHPAEAERLVHECLAIFAETRARPMVQVALSICGVLAILRGAPRRGAQLLGAGSLKGGHFRLLLPDDLQAYEESQAAAQIALGEEWFTTAYCAGQAMTLEHAVAYALEKQGNGADGWAITKEPLV